jgi:putative transposase
MLFDKAGNFAAFEKALGQTWERSSMRLLSYVALSNHWHLVVWPQEDGQLSAWAQWLTATLVRLWHAHCDSPRTAIRPEMAGQTEQIEVSNCGNVT